MKLFKDFKFINTGKISQSITQSGNNIEINGKSYTGNNVTMVNGKIIIDGKEVESKEKVINVVIHKGYEGDLDIKSCNSIIINGDVTGSVKTSNGDISCGNVGKNVNTTNGNVDADNIYGNVDTVNGNIKFKK